MSERIARRSTEARLRANRNHYREESNRLRRERDEARELAEHFRQKFEAEKAITIQALQQSRTIRRVGAAAAILVAFIVGGWFNSGKTDTQPAASAPLRPMASDDSPDDLPTLPQLDCPDCQTMPPATTEPHILASVKMANGGIGCSATVIGDPREFRKFERVAIVTAAHCVKGNIGGECTFHNPDGRTSFSAKLIAYDRSMDAAIFTAESRFPLGAVLMADPESWDQHALFSSCNYPAQSGGPNYKLVKFAGSSNREGADLGNLFTIDETSQRHGGYFNSGGSGGGLFVQPRGSREWFFASATTHGGDGRSIATPQCKKLFDWIRRVVPGDCGPWGCKPRNPPKQPGKPTPPEKPDEDGKEKPPWYKPNVPIDPPSPEPPPPNEKPDPEPIKDSEAEKRIESRFERIETLIAILEKNQTAIPAEGPPGPAGKDGAPGKDATIDLEKIRLEANAAAVAEVKSLVAAGALKGPAGEPGKPWTPGTATPEELDALAKGLPPIKFTIIRDGKEYPKEAPLGGEFKLRFKGQQRVVTAGN